jgi:hypothetical protein
MHIIGIRSVRQTQQNKNKNYKYTIVLVYIIWQHVSTLTGSSSGRGIAEVLQNSKG